MNYGGRMIVWINGTFGVGKTTTATRLKALDPEWRLFDPEHVGYLLSSNLHDVAFDDFQELPPWRKLVPVVADEIMKFTGDSLVAVQSVLVEEYWRELRLGLAERDVDVFHVVLDCDEAALRDRIIADEVERGAEQWRLDHIASYEAARSWMVPAADLTVQTAGRTPDDVASEILTAVDARPQAPVQGRSSPVREKGQFVGKSRSRRGV